MRQIVIGNIGTGEPKLRKALEKYKNMSDLEKELVKATIIKNLNIHEYTKKSK